MDKLEMKIQNAAIKPISTPKTIEQPTMYGQCCCCLELPCLKGLWAEYSWMEQTEVYGDMLRECFNVNWPQDEKSKHLICEVCITQLRNAMNFKRRIMRSHAALSDLMSAVKMESVEEKNHVMDKMDVITTVKTESVEEIVEASDKETGVEHTTKETTVDGDPKHSVKLGDDVTKHDALGDDDDIFEDTDAVITNDGTASEETTLKITSDKLTNSNLKNKKKRKLTEFERKQSIEQRKLDYIKPRQNATLILEHSTIIPFKSNKGYFSCFYCNKQHVGFEELKTHVIQLHNKMTFKSIAKCIFKPQIPVKADVSDITCRLCKTKVDNIDILVTHLTTKHKIKFNIEDTRMATDYILGYILNDGKYRCCICKNDFLYFKTLSNHMNTHSSAHICDVCGQCFLLAERLKSHRVLHFNRKPVQCDKCDKVFSSTITLKSHIRYTHSKILYMCVICDKYFPTYVLKVKHLKEIHKHSINIACKICFKAYQTPRGLRSHMASEHSATPRYLKFCCNTCDMKFKSQYELNSHVVVHSGEKNFECEYCHKKYARFKTLAEHLKIHRNDKRWSCGACSQSFVQKCSLKNHIRVHHTELDYEKLIVYKKPDPE